MKDYSNFFKHPEAFITDIDINYENGIMLVTFSDDETNTYPATKENITRFRKKLEAQYKGVIANPKKVTSDKKTLIIGLVSLSVAVVSAIAYAATSLFPTLYNLGSIFTPDKLYGILGTDIVLATVGITASKKSKSKHLEELETYGYILENMEELEIASESDNNILANVSEETIKQVEVQEELKEAGIVDNIFNVLSMDRIDIEDLRELSNQLKRYKGLKSEPELKISTDVKRKEKSR